MGARRLMGTAMLTVGLGGGSCTGKTSIARQLLDLLPRCVVLHQDSYYRKEDDPGHVLHPGTNCIDWEVLQAFHMDRMVSDARAALAALQKKSADMKPPSDASPSITSLPTSDASPSITSLPPSDASPSITSLPPSVASLPPYLVTALDRVSHLPLLLIEGICVLNEPRLAEICDLKFFFEIDETTCRARRQEKGEWGEDSDCWSETPEYFRHIAWPGYVSNREGIRNVPGVIYLDSTTSTVDQHLFEVLKRVVSHLQDQL